MRKSRTDSSLRLDPGSLSLLQRIATKHNTTVSKIVRRAVAEYRERRDAKAYGQAS